MRPVGVRDAGEIERVIATFAGSSNDGLILTGSALAYWCRNWQVGRLLALEDAIDVARRASVLIDPIRCVGDQAATSDEDTV